MAEFTAVAEQTVAFGQPVTFSTTTIPCRLGLINHLDGSGLFTLQPFQSGNSGCCCCCQNDPEYLVAFHANIALPTTGAAGEIGLAIQMGGVTMPASLMVATPTVVQAYFNVGTDGSVPLWGDCCQNLAVINTSATSQPILVRNARLRIVPNM